MKITSVNNKIVKEVVKLHLKKYRDKTGLFLVEGYHLYEEAFKVGNIEDIYTTDETILGNNVTYVSQQVLEKLAQTKTPQGIIAVCKKVKPKPLTDKVLILEGLQDPGNLGTLLRSALAFGFKTIVLDNTVDLYNKKVLRSTQGAIYKLSIVQKSTEQFMDEYPEYTYFGTELFGQKLKNIKKPKKVALILGNEGSGIRKEILEKTSENITIETKEVESLNVGVAGSIIMHYFSS